MYETKLYKYLLSKRIVNMEHCHFFQINSLLGKKWSYVVLQEMAGPEKQGFNQISKRIPQISPKILSVRLSTLQEEGLIRKEQGDTNTAWTSYQLTKKGKELLTLYDSLKEWSNKYSGNDWKCAEKSCVDCNLYFE